MVNPARRSTSAKKRMVRTPGGNVRAIYKTKKPSKATCAICKRKLHGVPNRSVAHMRKLAKTEKRPERIFGGVLCARCVSRLVREKIRLESGILLREEVDITHLKYIDMMKR
ncbi:MAG TPA: 50S ribosomal protein L34e [Candidatus Norongarragalinales archaeon]|nr:50S ribosomal protein L34e [Candidatus Norongarragalinales archaeon]